MVDVAINCEADVMEEKSLQLGGRFVGDEEAFGGAKEPEEGGNDEVDGGPVDLTFIRMVSVKGSIETMDDGHIGGVGTGGWVILVMEVLEKSCQ